MNPTSLEYLYQIAPPVPDRAPATSRGDDGSSGFDDHLNQATTSALDIVRTPSRSDSRPSYSPVNRSSTGNDDSNRSSSATRPSDSKPPQKDASSNDSNAAASSNPVADPPRADSCHDNKRDDHRDKDKADDGDATSAAGTAQAASNDTAKAADKSAKGAEQSAVEDAKDKVAADNIAKAPATKTDAASNNTKVDQSAPATAELKVGLQTKKTANDGVAIAEQTTGVKSSKTDVSGKPAKTAAKSKATNASSAKAALTKDPVQSVEAGEQSVSKSAAATGSNEVGVQEAQTTVDAAQLTAKTTSDQKATNETDLHHSDKDPTSSATPSDKTAVAEATNNATAVAVVVAPNPIAAAADKSNNSDDSTAKPIDAKPDVTAGALGRAFQKDLGATAKTSGANDSSPVDITRFVSRVAKAVQTARDRDGVVQLRLSPPELGSLKIQLTVKDGVMSAALEADNSNARRMLLDHLPALRDRLAGQNIRVDRFDVDVKQENNGSQANPRGSSQNPYQQQAQRPDPRRTAAKSPQVAEAASIDAPVATPRINATGINLVI
jgi:flagellar hook-length control protein FliK